MKITSNDTIQLKELYKELRRDRQDNITLDKVPIENAMGVDIVLNIDIDATKIIIELFKTYLEYKLIKAIFLKKPSGEQEVIDAEILEDPKQIEDLKIDKDTILYIEYQER